MTTSAHIAALNAYNHVKTESAAYADPHQLIAMLMDGALQRMGSAIQCGRDGRYVEKTRLVSQTIEIIDGLRGCLEKEQGGELAENLDNLYEYMGRRLSQCLARKDTTPIVEARDLLREIFDAWGQIPMDIRQQKR